MFCQNLPKWYIFLNNDRKWDNIFHHDLIMAGFMIGIHAVILVAMLIKTSGTFLEHRLSVLYSRHTTLYCTTPFTFHTDPKYSI